MEERLKSSAAIDLIEDGAHRPVRALSDRRRYIRDAWPAVSQPTISITSVKSVCSVFFHSSTTRRFLILDAYGSELREMGEKFTRLRPDRPHMGSDRQTRETYALFEAATAQLERLSRAQPRQIQSRC